MARFAWRIDPPSFAGEDTRRGEAPHLPEGVGNVVEIDLGGGRRVRLLPWRRTPNSLAESSPGSCVPPGCGGAPPAGRADVLRDQRRGPQRALHLRVGDCGGPSRHADQRRGMAVVRRDYDRGRARDGSLRGARPRERSGGLVSPALRGARIRPRRHYQGGAGGGSGTGDRLQAAGIMERPRDDGGETMRGMRGNKGLLVAGTLLVLGCGGPKRATVPGPQVGGQRGTGGEFTRGGATD